MMTELFRIPFRWPHTVMIAVVATWLVFGVFMPFTTVNSEATWRGVSAMCLFVVAFVLGSVAVKVTAPARSSIHPSPISSKINLHLLFTLVSAIAAVGIFMRVYDYTILRGFSFSLASGQENRFADLQTLYGAGGTNASILSLIAAPLSACAIFPTLICFIMTSPRLWQKAVAYAMFGFPAFEAAFFRGGSVGLFFSLIFLFCIFGYRRKGRPVRANTKLVFVALAISVFLAGGLMFVSRVTRMFGSNLAYLSASSAGDVVAPSDMTLWLAKIPAVGSLATMFYWISSYVGQGFHEFIYLVDNYGSGPHTGGEVQGALVLKLLSMLFRTAYNPLAWLVNPRAGKYQTIFGDVFIDFGITAGAIQCVVMGGLFAMAHTSRVRGDRTGQFMDPILKTFVIMGIAVSSFSGALVYYLVAAILVTILSHTIARRSSAPRYGVGSSHNQI